MELALILLYGGQIFQMLAGIHPQVYENRDGDQQHKAGLRQLFDVVQIGQSHAHGQKE